ncbi:glutamate racemase [Bdellovibrio bacteriovorus]|uniref:Glutamate racemase n=1 Tax=Bdellovibrio bacteriovorus TaxID=959 RepID=A0A150WTM2_BDEBC|nr:glutamate racemase [Bdellovibrio bacteriovorus]KYG69849.1 glutamate racemase [Bdellovibrio bacteriovorus]
MLSSDTRPIGVFDSGIGGLTVLRELAVRFPQENFLYLGDTARLPYGSKSPSTIRKYSEQNIHFLEKQRVKAIVIACNTASSQLTEKEFDGLPIYNVIEPGSQRALEKSTAKKIGVLGTRATVNSQAYRKKILELHPQAEVFDQACPLFVPLAEEGWDSDPVTNLIVFRYVSPLLGHSIDTLILGCTHYPILKSAISRVTGSAVELVDSGEAIAHWLDRDFTDGRLGKNASQEERIIEIMTTDHSAHFTEVAHRILTPLTPHSFRVVDL